MIDSASPVRRFAAFLFLFILFWITFLTLVRQIGNFTLSVFHICLRTPFSVQQLSSLAFGQNKTADLAFPFSLQRWRWYWRAEFTPFICDLWLKWRWLLVWMNWRLRGENEWDLTSGTLAWHNPTTVPFYSQTHGAAYHLEWYVKNTAHICLYV